MSAMKAKGSVTLYNMMDSQSQKPILSKKSLPNAEFCE